MSIRDMQALPRTVELTGYECQQIIQTFEQMKARAYPILEFTPATRVLIEKLNKAHEAIVA